MKPAHTVRNSAVRRCSAIVTWLLLLLCLTAPLAAQDNTPAAAEPAQGRILYRLDDGRVVPIEELGVSAESVEKWIIMQRQSPGFDTIMNASGTVHRAHAEIHVELKIEVHADNEWVRVPVGFQSWTITSSQHLADDDSFESRFAGNASGKREWFLRGKGTHTLVMDLIGDVRDPEADRQRLRISMPDAVTSQLELTFDFPVQNVRGNRGFKSMDGPSKAIFFGLQQETDITWESAATNGEQTSVMIAPEPAAMTLDLTTSTAVLTCRQVINISDGAIDRLSVRLPPGFSQAAVTGNDESGSSVVKSDDVTTEDGVSTANIVFTRPIRRRVELQFDLRPGEADPSQPDEDASDEDTIFVSIPDIQGISEQSATVNIRKPRGLFVDISPGLLTQRIRVDSQAGLRSEATAFRLLSTEARLQLTVSEEEARFAVLPQLQFTTDNQLLLLLAQFPINVGPGSLDELLVTWKRFTEDGWQIDPGSITLTVDKGEPQRLAYEIRDPDTIRLVLRNFQSGEFLVQFRAFRSLIPAAEGVESGAFYLPDVEATDTHETLVSLVESDTYSLSLTNADDGSSFVMAPSRQLITPQDPNRVTTWRVDESGSEVRVQESRQTKEIRSTAVVELDVARDSIQVHTEVDMNVQYSDLQELRFTASESVLPELRISGEPEPLPPFKVDGDEFVWQLPEAIRGQHTLLLDYLWTPGSTDTSVRLPLVLPASGVESLVIGTRIPDVISVLHDENIPPVYSERFVAAWHTDEPLDAVLLHLPGTVRQHQARLPSICLVETQIGAVNVKTTTTVIYESRPETVQFSVPANAGVRATVNGVLTEAPKTELGALDSGEIRRVAVPADVVTDASGAVSVSLTCQMPRGPHHHLLSKEMPTYPRIVRPPEWLTTVWLVRTLDSNKLVSLDSQQYSLVGRDLTHALRMSSTDGLATSIETALGGLPDSVRQLFEQRLEETQDGPRVSLAFVAGPQLQSISVLIYSRAVGLVIAAGLGILIYTSLVTFRQHLKLLTAIVVPLGVLIWGLLPQQTLAMLFPVLPAFSVALAAWIIRQMLMPSSARRRLRRRRTTVFSAASRPPSGSSLVETAGSAASVPEAEPALQ